MSQYSYTIIILFVIADEFCYAKCLLFLKNNFLIISYLYNLTSLLPNACNIEQNQNIFLILIGIISIYMNLGKISIFMIFSFSFTTMICLHLFRFNFNALY